MVIVTLLVVVSAVASMTSADPIFNLFDFNDICEECETRTDVFNELLCSLLCEDTTKECDSDEDTGQSSTTSTTAIGDNTSQSDSSASTIAEISSETTSSGKQASTASAAGETSSQTPPETASSADKASSVFSDGKTSSQASPSTNA